MNKQVKSIFRLNWLFQTWHWNTELWVLFNDLVFSHRQPLQIIRFTGTITQSSWLSDSEAVAQVCLNHSAQVGGGLTPTGCFDTTGPGLPSAADPHRICCYCTEEAPRRPPLVGQVRVQMQMFPLLRTSCFPSLMRLKATAERFGDGSELRGEAAITHIATLLSVFMPQDNRNHAVNPGMKKCCLLRGRHTCLLVSRVCKCNPAPPPPPPSSGVVMGAQSVHLSHSKKVLRVLACLCWTQRLCHLLQGQKYTVCSFLIPVMHHWV